MLSAVALMLRRLVSTYISSPYLLAFVPFVLGVMLGMVLMKVDAWGMIRTPLGWWQVMQTKVLQAVFHIQRKGLFDEEEDENSRDEVTRSELKSAEERQRESEVSLTDIPRHVAVIMDGNRRYGKAKYGNATRGHWDGSKKLVQFCKWCLAEKIPVLTVYAFSTENWSRPPAEVDALMAIFCKYCDELRLEAIDNGIQIRVLTTDDELLPDDVKCAINRMVTETSNFDSKNCNLVLNVCLSYGSRSEIVGACRKLAASVVKNNQNPDEHITETSISQTLLTADIPDPDIVIRTSGEMRLSNFLLWQCAYSEMFFLNRQWPEITKDDLLQIIENYAKGRKRRYGK